MLASSHTHWDNTHTCGRRHMQTETCQRRRRMNGVRTSDSSRLLSDKVLAARCSALSLNYSQINSTETLSSGHSKQKTTSHLSARVQSKNSQIITAAICICLSNIRHRQCFSSLVNTGSACYSPGFSLPYRPPWRGISCPGLEVATCGSTSHTCLCNGYDHWGRQVAMKMGDERGEGEGGEESKGEGWCWRWRSHAGREWGGGGKREEEEEEWRRYKRKDYSKAAHRRREQT